MTLEFATTLTTPRWGETLVVTRCSVASYRFLHNLIRMTGFAPGSKPTTLSNISRLYNQEKTTRANRAMLDIGTWWRKHLRLPIGDWERGWINYLTIDSKPNLNSCSFFVLRPTEWQWTVSLWLWTSFNIRSQMWGEMRGRCEDLPVGNFFGKAQGTGFKIQFSRGFPVMNRFQNLDFSTVSHDF